VRFTYLAEWYWKRGVQPALKRIAVNAFEALKLQNVNDLQKKRGVFTRSRTFAIAIPFHLQDHVLVARSIYVGIPERGRSEGDSFENRRDLKISIISAI